jgi:6-phosphogluconolactonase
MDLTLYPKNHMYMNYYKILTLLLGLFIYTYLVGETSDTSIYMYVSLKSDNAVKLYKVSKHTGTPEFVYFESIAGGPACVAIHPTKQFLYVAQRTSNSISAYQINQYDGRLIYINTIPAIDNPVYISIDKTGKFLLSAYFSANKAAVYEINLDGSLKSTVVQSISTGTGTNPHAILTDPSNKYLYLTNMTGNRIDQFRFDALTGTFIALSPASITPPSTLGPRHFTFYPSTNIVYVANELGNSVTAYHYDVNTGQLSDFQSITTSPVNYSAANKPADIHLTPDERFLYVSNRGHESIAAFAVNQTNGTLSSIGYYFTTTSPREFDIDPTGNFLYSAGESSNNLAWYRINKQTGVLDSISTIEVGKVPSWVLCTEIISPVTTNKYIKKTNIEALKIYNSPNPFNLKTSIHYYLNKPTQIKLQIYDSNGRLLSTLRDAFETTGLHTQDWSGIRTNGEKLSPGIYYCRLTTSFGIDSVKLVLN